MTFRPAFAWTLACAIRVSAREGDTVRVSITNDGADDAPASVEPSGGIGIASLTARVAATGGTLTTTATAASSPSRHTCDLHVPVVQLAQSSECARHYLTRSCAASVER